MKIIIDKEFRAKYGNGLDRKGKAVKEIVVHATAGGSSAKAVIQWMINGERASEYLRGVSSFHYVINFDGLIYEVIDPQYWVYHSSSGKHDQQTIGIELMDKTRDNTGEYTPEQYKALAYLIGHLGTSFPEIEQVTTHKYNIQKYSKQFKQCPSDKFSFDTLKKELQKCGVISTTITEGIAI
jgi:N-acetyl-anhydromuramyl-L-alanine amidase AmpD